ncbi:MAG: hypothetical protein AAB943_00865 [Patescibacteria group bacterium]
MWAKNKQGGPASTKQGGFLQIIILVLIVLFIMKYSGVTISDAKEWFETTFADVLR